MRHLLSCDLLADCRVAVRAVWGNLDVVVCWPNHRHYKILICSTFSRKAEKTNLLVAGTAKNQSLGQSQEIPFLIAIFKSEICSPSKLGGKSSALCENFVEATAISFFPILFL